MPDHELSLDDIFSRIKKEGGDLKKEIRVPFKFLDSYTREDESIFFGRDNEIEELFRKLYSGKLLLVYGKSGTGKSSIVNCGLISKIPQEDIYTINIRCGGYAYQNFISEIKKHSGMDQNSSLDILENIFFEHSKPVALIFDQFEEVFILSDEEERKKLATGLNEIMKSRLKVNIILVIREEYFANLTEFESVIPGLYGNRVRIERMNRYSGKEAIIKPCLACNIEIEEVLADKIIDQLVLKSEGLELTWLQILMDRLYRTAAGRDPENPVINDEDLVSLGRIGNVLSNFLDEQLRQMPEGELGEAVLKTMISTDGTKKLMNPGDISAALEVTGRSVGQNVIEEILMYLVKVRIITDKNEEGFYELRHDAIAGRIFERMTANEKEIIEVRSFLDNSLRIFKQRNVLLSDSDLKYIDQFETRLILNNEQKEFIELSRKEILRTRVRRRNLSLAAVIILIAVLSGFSVWAVIERTKALEQSRVAEEQKNEALKANREAENAKLLALNGENKAKENEAIAVEQKKVTEEQKQAALSANREAEASRRQANEEKNKAVENEKLALAAKLEAEDARNLAEKADRQAKFYLYLFNGKELANKSLMMQEKDTLRTLLSLSAYDLVTYGYKSFSHDNEQVKYDGDILKSLQNSYFLFNNNALTEGEIWAISSGYKMIVYSNSIGQLNISELDTARKDKLPALKTVRTINSPLRSMLRSLCFDQRSKMFACGTIDGDVFLFDDIESKLSEPKLIYNHNKNRVLCLAFVHGKNWLISSSTDDTIHIWDLSQGKTIKKIPVGAPVRKFVLIGEDHLVYTNSTGNILSLDLNNTDREPAIVYSGNNRQPFQTLAYNPSHRWLVVSRSGTISVFTINPEEINIISSGQFTMKHKSQVSQAGFSPDGYWLVTASPDAIMLWDLHDASDQDIDKLVPIVVDNNRQIFSIAFDEQSKYFFSGDDKTLHIYALDIKDIYSRLRYMMGKKELTGQEWKYYVKGDLIRPNRH
jgi:WD40 repeat protein